MEKVQKRTKIVATLGPASSDKEVLKNMVFKGVDVCRLNFSHGSQDDHLKVINTIKEINKEENLNIGILADLQGPKIRVGEMIEGGAELITGETVEMTTHKQIGDDQKIYISYENFPKDVSKDEVILLDDGKLQLKVLETNNKDSVKCEIVHGGILTSRKGVNLPNTKVSIPSITDEDIDNLKFALDQGADWIAMSFVRSAEDIKHGKKLIAEHGSSALVIAKIEKPEAIQNIDAIIEASDGIMVARGDLGVEMPMEEVPGLQKIIVQKCRDLSKPVIIATQMLESMINTPRPTRAEVNDVANSVLDGADAVMLSGETSVGEFPEIVIEIMCKVITHIEETSYPYNIPKKGQAEGELLYADSICDSSVILASKTQASALIVMTSSGYTAFEIASYRPNANIHVFTGTKKLLTTLSLLWGVTTFTYEKNESTDATIQDVNEILKQRKLIKPGEVVINTASTPLHEKGRTNTVRVSVVK